MDALGGLSRFRHGYVLSLDAFGGPLITKLYVLRTTHTEL